MIAVWDFALGREIEVRLSDERSFRGILVAIAMESVASGSTSAQVGEFRFLVAIKDDGTILDMPARSCQFGPGVAGGIEAKKENGGNS